ncbi:MAG TPA: sugar transferase [Verrucomicrobiales bacterium]|nr:sugar transferase [Verrucomicrobiales bacterium]
MFGRKQEISLQFNQILDSLLLAFLFWFAHWVRYEMQDWFDLPVIPTFENFLWVMAVIVPFTPVALEFQGYYTNVLQKSPFTAVRQLFQAMVYIGLVIGACVVFLKWTTDSRTVLVMFAGLTVAAFLAKEAIYKGILRKRLLSGQLKEAVVLIGRPEDVEEVLEHMPLEQQLEMDVVARLDIDEVTTGGLIELLHTHSVARVVFAAEHAYFSQVQEALIACEREGVEVWLSADFFRTTLARPGFENVGGRPMLVFRTTPDISWALLFKNAFDRVGAGVLIVASSPLWIVAWLGIRMSSPGPVLFRQERGGLYGRPFTMYKFRTMNHDAEHLRAELEEQNEMCGPVFKIEEDPRVFRFGKLLRQFSIDELPQLINVLLGQMSLVGPRPLPVYEVEKIERSEQRRRLSVKPGLTCLWQVGGRNRITDFEEWVQLDLKYIDNWSLWLDLKILLKTIPAVLSGFGAR